MKFPNMYEIATRDVVTVDCEVCLHDTIEMLRKSHHTSIIVVNDKEYFLFSANDLIKLKLSDSKLDKKLKDIHLSKVPTINKNCTVIDGMDIVNGGAKTICVIDEDGSIFGIVTNSDIISRIDPETLMENVMIRDYFKKNSTINYIDKNQTILDALNLINSGSTDYVIVTDNNIPKGILTSKDTISIISTNIGLNHKIDEFCSCPLQTISDNFTIKEAVDYVNKKHFKRIIATDKNGNITGIISQQELISYSYSNWATMMKNYHDELLSLNTQLKEKSEKLQLMATTDMLTKLYNRHMFAELFEKFLAKKKRNCKEKLILSLLDIDNFKSVNDTYGHNIGDEVLKSISNFLISNLRASDISARWGGEEFIVLLTNTDIEIGFNTINKLRIAISQLEQSFGENVTVSIGITEVKENDTLQSCIKRADDALYTSKESGKNKVSIKI